MGWVRFAASVVAALAGWALAAAPAHAEKVIWQYDSLPGAMEELANGLKQHPLSAHPGFVQGEAFGVLFKPKPEDYPVKILTVEFVMAQPDGQKDQKLDVGIEIYNDDGNGPAPKGAPVFNVSSKDFAQGGTIGQPVVGNMGMVYQFDWSKPENHPPLIDKGNIYLVIRFMNASSSLETYWNKLECTKTNLGIGAELCGCQKLAALSDTATTKGVNFFNIVWPIGTCSGTKVWKWAEDVYASNPNIKGDFVLRMGVDGVGGGSTGGDTGGPTDAGSTGGDSGGADAGSVKDTAISASPEISNVTPASGPSHKPNQIDVYGKNFQPGLTAKLGTEAIKVVDGSVTAGMFSAIVVGVAPGVYDLVVKNPDGQVAFKAAAYTVTAPPAPDAVDAIAEVAPDVAAELAAEAALGDGLAVEAVNPPCVQADKDTLLTVLGLGFAPGIKVTVGGQALQAVDVVSAGKLTGLLPKGLAPGEYTLYVELGAKQRALPNAVKVATRCDGTGATTPPASDGCQTGRGAPAALAVLALAVAAVALRRRRAALGHLGLT